MPFGNKTTFNAVGTNVPNTGVPAGDTWTFLASTANKIILGSFGTTTLKFPDNSGKSWTLVIGPKKDRWSLQS